MGAIRVILLPAALLSLVAAAEVRSQTSAHVDAERVREIERTTRRLAAADSFSGVVLVAKGANILYLGAFGSEGNRPIAVDTRMPLASITKTFVTVAIARLADDAKLSWDDPVGKFIPDFPLAQARERVRIRHLLTHTSGLREIDSAPQRPRSIDDYVRLVARAQRDSLVHAPGTRSAYRNANYTLLAKIVEVASGRPFHEYIREQIVRPTGMRSTDWGESESAPDYPAPYAGMRSTAPDLFLFARALGSGRIVGIETAALLLTSKPEAGHWGYGFDILDEKRGIAGHGGSWTGMSNSLDLYTRSGHTVVILSNRSGGRSPLRERIRALLAP